MKVARTMRRVKNSSIKREYCSILVPANDLQRCTAPTRACRITRCGLHISFLVSWKDPTRRMILSVAPSKLARKGSARTRYKTPVEFYVIHHSTVRTDAETPAIFRNFRHTMKDQCHPSHLNTTKSTINYDCRLKMPRSGPTKANVEWVPLKDAQDSSSGSLPRPCHADENHGRRPFNEGNNDKNGAVTAVELKKSSPAVLYQREHSRGPLKKRPTTPVPAPRMARGQKLAMPRAPHSTSDASKSIPVPATSFRSTPAVAAEIEDNMSGLTAYSHHKYVPAQACLTVNSSRYLIAQPLFQTPLDVSRTSPSWAAAGTTSGWSLPGIGFATSGNLSSWDPMPLSPLLLSSKEAMPSTTHPPAPSITHAVVSEPRETSRELPAAATNASHLPHKIEAPSTSRSLLYLHPMARRSQRTTAIPQSSMRHPGHFTNGGHMYGLHRSVSQGGYEYHRLQPVSMGRHVVPIPDAQESKSSLLSYKAPIGEPTLKQNILDAPKFKSSCGNAKAPTRKSTSKRHASSDDTVAALPDLFVNPKSTNKQCRCPNTKCLKLYCECFRNGVLCDARICKCRDCLNDPKHNYRKGPREYAILKIISKRPDAFFQGPRAHHTSKSCTCKKSR